MLSALAAVAAAQGSRWFHGIMVTSFDGVKISLDASIPDPIPSNMTLPLVVLPNSWGVPEFEYLIQTWDLASRGYVVVEYQTRGWFESGGYIEVASPADVADAKAVIDWAIARFPFVDPARVGMMGISYGAGISLLVAANDTRVTTVCALSGWASLMQALWWGQSPSRVWGSVLVDVGDLLGRPDPEVAQRWFDIENYNDVPATKAWGLARSPNKNINAFKGKAVYISNNFEDNIFHAHHALEFWQALPAAHKRMSLSQGIHASAELGGLVVEGNYIFDTATMWLDRFLRGVNNGIDAPPLVDMQMDDYGDFSTRFNFATWPRPGIAPTIPLWLVPRPSADIIFPHYGGLSSSGPGAPGDASVNTVGYSPLLTTFDAGLPVVGDVFKVFVRIPIMHETRVALPAYDYVFRADPTPTGEALCGLTTLTNLTIISNTDSGRFSVYAYLYDEEPITGVAMLVSHAPSSVWDGYQSGTPVTLPPIEFRATCYRLAAGHRLLLVLNMHCALYEPAHANATAPTATVDFSTSFPVLNIPTPAAM